MLTFLTLVGVILLLLGFVGLFYRHRIQMKDSFGEPTQITKQNYNHYNDGSDSYYELNGEYFHREPVKSSPSSLIKLTQMAWMFILLGFPLSLSTSLFLYAEPTSQYFLVHLNGKTDAIMTQGFKLRMFAPTVQEWPKYIDIKSPTTTEGEKVNLSDLEGVMKPIPIRFIDQVTADMFVSTRFQIPNTEEGFIAMAMKFKTLDNLVYNTLIPTIKEQANNTGYMFAAQDYISGASQEFRKTFDEQLKNGAFEVRKVEYRDTTWNSDITQSNDRGVKNISTRYEVEKILGKDGRPIRIPNEISENKIIVSQVLVDNVEPDKDYQDRLKQQKDESAKRQLEQQKIETAKIAQQRVIAEGEQKKAAERVTQETDQVGVLIAIETKLKQEKTNKELAEIAYQTAMILSRTVKVNADAKQYELQKADGLSAEVQFIEEQKTKRALAMADAIKNAKLPTTVINSGGGKDGKETSLLESLLGVSLLNQMNPEVKPKN